MKTYKDTQCRSILKALSWRLCATLTTMLIVFGFTRELVLSAGVGIVEVLTKLVLYFLHERMWGLLGIGIKEHPLSSLAVDRPLEQKDMQEIEHKLKELGYTTEE